MRLKALTRSGTGMTDQQCEVDKMCGLRGRRELTITQVVKLVRTGWSWLGRWTEEPPARLNSCRGGLGVLSLRKAIDDEAIWQIPDEVAAPRLVGAGNDKWAWWWMKEAATKSWRRDVHWQVSSLFSGLMNRMTIPARGAFSTGRVPVGRGR